MFQLNTFIFSLLMNMINDYYVAKNTKLHKYLTKTGFSKNEEWLQIKNVPCKVINIDNKLNKIILNSFTSSVSRNFLITTEELNDDFYKIEPNENGELNIQSYPVPINIEEFELRNEVKKLEKMIKNVKINNKIPNNIKKIFEDKLFQLLQSQGSPYISIKEYYDFKEGKIKLSQHKRFGYEIFNRNSRWCPPINITYEEFLTDSSYPAPLGIRPKDFCLPSEIVETIKELIIQIVNFKNVDMETFEELKKILPFIKKTDVCLCKYCGENININDYYSEYKSCDNYIEICHRNPNERYTKENMYWGHGECNRRQGGYSEKERMIDGLKLLLLNKKIDETSYQFLYNQINL